MKQPQVVIKKANERFQTKIDWLDSYHSFSFGPHYDPNNTRHGLLLVNNDDVIRPSSGFHTHPHEDMEIVTWVLSGELEHKDSTGQKGIIYPGLAQRMSAGRGIWHSEMNPSKTDPVRLVQMWVLPDTLDVEPGYEQLDVNKELSQGGLVPIASGRDSHAAIKINQKGAVLWAARMRPKSSIKIPDARYIHVYVPLGKIQIEGVGVLHEGDAARIVEKGGLSITTHDKDSAEVLIWEM